MDVDDQIEDNEGAGDYAAEPSDVPAAIKPEVLAISIKLARLWPVGK